MRGAEARKKAARLSLRFVNARRERHTHIHHTFFSQSIHEAPRAEKGVWSFFEKDDKLIEIDANGFGLDVVLFWASGTQ